MKIKFLCLHLGYGGIESATVNTANALSEYYDIEIVSFYQLDKVLVHDINSNIKVTYLYQGGPNKKEIINCIKKYKFISLFKNLILAIKILYLKKKLIIKNIKETPTGVIISTRVDFSTLLSKYGHTKVIKIAQEHHHHNNDKKYINKLKNKYINIDYLMALTNSLKHDYEQFLINNDHTKIITMPNMLKNIPKTKANLTKKIIVSVGRLHESKNFSELIDIIGKIKDKNWVCNIIGDGDQFEILNQQIKQLKLEKNVFLLGRKSPKEVYKYLKEASIFAMTSLTEGLPMVLLEAMSVGLPCIAYNTLSGVKDIINNKNGYIINNKNEYVKKLTNLMDNFETRSMMQKEAIKTANNYSKENITTKWLNLLEQFKEK